MFRDALTDGRLEKHEPVPLFVLPLPSADDDQKVVQLKKPRCPEHVVVVGASL